MIPTLKAEFKKLFTIRSTYITSSLFFLLTAFVAFYAQGFKDSANLTSATPDKGALFLSGTLLTIANAISVAGALIALLLLAHEYRYNTIVYALTASNSRSKVLASKIIAILIYVFAFSLVTTAVALGLIVAGVAAAGNVLPHQDINYVTYVAKSVFACEGFAMAGLLFAALIRNQVGALAALFILPNTLEGILSLLLKHNSVYMPFTALQQVIQPPSLTDAHTNIAATGYLSPAKGAVVFLAYLFAAWAIAWYLFLKRDAT